MSEAAKCMPGEWTCHDGERWASHTDWRGDWSGHLDDTGGDEAFDTESIAIREDEVIALVVHADTRLVSKDVDPTTAARARLIAAAPDLLAACEAMLLTGKTPADIDVAYKLMQQAVIKAKGL